MASPVVELRRVGAILRFNDHFRGTGQSVRMHRYGDTQLQCRSEIGVALRIVSQKQIRKCPQEEAEVEQLYHRGCGYDQETIWRFR